MRWLATVLSLALVAGCGAQRHRVVGVEESTQLVVRAEQMIGDTVSVEPTFRKVITKDDLTPYQLGVLGAKDREEERLQTVTIKVSPGTHRVRVERGGVVLLDQEMYFGQGQTRELRVK